MDVETVEALTYRVIGYTNDGDRLFGPEELCCERGKFHEMMREMAWRVLRHTYEGHFLVWALLQDEWVFAGTAECQYEGRARAVFHPAKPHWLRRIDRMVEERISALLRLYTGSDPRKRRGSGAR